MSIGNDDVSKIASSSTGELPKATRRRGEALEKSLLNAAWEVLARSGFGGFTMEAVATQACTSRPVLYRRWSSVSELAMDAIRNRAIENTVELPDTGNLRDDLVTFLDELGKRREEILVLFSVGAAQVFSDTKGTFAEFFERIHVPERGRARIRTILERAASRGQVDAARMTPRVTSLPLDLLRHEVLTTLKPVPRAVLEEIIDDVFLPLVRATTAKSGS